MTDEIIEEHIPALSDLAHALRQMNEARGVTLESVFSALVDSLLSDKSKEAMEGFIFLSEEKKP